MHTTTAEVTTTTIIIITIPVVATSAAAMRVASVPCTTHWSHCSATCLGLELCCRRGRVTHEPLLGHCDAVGDARHALKPPPLLV